MTGRSIIYQFSNERRNDADITFSPLMLPDDWDTTNLDQGLRMVLIKTVDAYLRDTRFD